MAGNSIITPGYDESVETPEQTLPIEQYLLKSNRLSEYNNDTDAAIVRRYLRVPSSESVYDRDTVDLNMSKAVKKVIEDHLNTEDPHGILSQIGKELKKVNWIVKDDGSVPFKAPQKGVDPISDDHLTTKRFVTKKINEHLGTEDPHDIITKVKELLKEYLKPSDVYSKSQLYTKGELDKQFTEYIKKDGTTPFVKPQISVDPTGDMHLANKRYVDGKVREHLVSVDPHGFLTILNQRLASYAKSADYLDKTETYSRSQIDNIINRVVDEVVSQSLQNYKEQVSNRIDSIFKENYVKSDGSVPFENPQVGVEAKEDSHLVTLGQLNKVKETLSDQIKKDQCYWITSGPVETTVGFLEDNSRVPEKMSIQEVLDAIFYGKKVSVTSPETGKVGESVDVVVCITGGDLSTVDVAYLYQNGVLIRVLQREDFEESGCVTVTSDKIDSDTEFEFEVFYSNDAKHSEYSETKLAFPIFVGIIDEWKFANTVSYSDLVKLSEKDPVNNKFYDRDDHLRELTHYYNFDEEKPVKLLLALPRTYPNLEAMMNGVQKFTKGAFTQTTVTPYTINGILTDYKLYVYNQPLVKLDSEITFKF